MNPYVDLCVRPRNPAEAEAMARRMASMGYGAVGVEGEAQLVKPFIEAGLVAVTRVTVEAETGAEALRLVRRIRGSYSIVALRPRGVEAARLAARDGRVDVVVLPPGMARYMDRSEARLLRLGGGVVEVHLRSVLEKDGRGLRGLMIIARRAVAYDTPFTVSSCATSAWELWHPYSVRGLLVSLGVPENHARLAVTAYPMQAIARGRGR